MYSLLLYVWPCFFSLRIGWEQYKRKFRAHLRQQKEKATKCIRTLYRAWARDRFYNIHMLNCTHANVCVHSSGFWLQFSMSVLVGAHSDALLYEQWTAIEYSHRHRFDVMRKFDFIWIRQSSNRASSQWTDTVINRRIIENDERKKKPVKKRIMHHHRASARRSNRYWRIQASNIIFPLDNNINFSIIMPCHRLTLIHFYFLLATAICSTCCLVLLRMLRLRLLCNNLTIYIYIVRRSVSVRLSNYNIRNNYFIFILFFCFVPSFHCFHFSIPAICLYNNEWSERKSIALYGIERRKKTVEFVKMSLLPTRGDRTLHNTQTEITL